MAVYVDASAITKLIVAEDESEALKEHLALLEPLITSALSRVEVMRAANRYGQSVVPQAIDVLDHFGFMEIHEQIVVTATRLPPPTMRSLDAIHLASASALGEDLDALVTYDRRMAEAAEFHGMTVESPI